MSSEIHYEGWLTKSPPTKRIWRARWRRRWFTLKQGELPGQYFLEYYTDPNCRKLKGMIDLDQCEQVDAGLFMERKFQHVFNVKTPRRTYYLAADTDEEMRYWVNCICHVCGLQQDLSKGPPPPPQQPTQLPPPTNKTPIATTTNDAEHSYFNIGPGAILEAPIPDRAAVRAMVQKSDMKSHRSEQEDRMYQNNSFAQGSHNKFNTIQHPRRRSSDQFSTLPTRRSGTSSAVTADDIRNNNSEDQHQYYNDVGEAQSLTTVDRNSNVTGVPSPARRDRRPVLEGLQLGDSVANVIDNSEPSPALSTSSGPYIPISECFSGSPAFMSSNSGFGNGIGNGTYENNFAHLNSLNPRFYDTPRSHTIGNLNLIADHSAKNTSMTGSSRGTGCSVGGQSSPSDSESVFTDDDSHSAGTQNRSTNNPALSNSLEERKHGGGGSGHNESGPQLRSHLIDRRLRPSDSSIENEQIGWTAVQRYSRVPELEKKCLNNNTEVENFVAPPPPPRPYKRNTLTDADQPQFGPKDSSCVVEEESYDIPRSHRRTNTGISMPGESPNLADFLATSTPNLIGGPLNAKIVNRPHCYTNAAPSTSGSTTAMGNVFRYDFFEDAIAAAAPAVNRNLKPKADASGTMRSYDPLEDTPPPTLENNMPDLLGPNVNRKLKPMPPLTKSTSMSVSLNQTTPNLGTMHDSSDDVRNPDKLASVFSQSMQLPNGDKLQYLDLDHTSTPPRPVAEPVRKFSASSAHNLQTVARSAARQLLHDPLLHHQHPHHQRGGSMSSGVVQLDESSSSSGRGIVYKTVDFVKTEAFKRTRQDAELNRASDRSKD